MSAPKSNELIVDRPAEKIVRITLNRPEKLNAISPDNLAAFDVAIEDFDSDDSASVLIIRGTGRAFSAGHDLHADKHSGDDRLIGADVTAVRAVLRRWQRFWSVSKPTIAQVQGYCMGLAVELVGCCDIVFASEDAKFGHPAGRALGIMPTVGLWPILMGPRKSKQYLFTGDLMSAKEAYDWHLVNEVVPDSELETFTLQYAEKVAMVPRELLVLHKQSVNIYYDAMGLKTAQEMGGKLSVIAHQSEAAKEFARTRSQVSVRAAITARDNAFKTQVSGPAQPDNDEIK
jgi:enoyl-CoA hydratase